MMPGLSRLTIIIYTVVLIFNIAGCASPPASRHAKKEPPYLLRTSTPSGIRVQGVYHTIKRGETLWRIAKTYNIDLQYLAELNNIDDPARITAGQKVFVPGATATKTLNPRYSEPPSTPPRITTGGKDFIWPVQGKVVSTFGIRNGLRYEGIEIAVPSETPVKASNDGEVVYEGNLKGYGNLVIIKHKNQFNTVYAYNQTNLVHTGRKVKKGEIIAAAGNTGPCSDHRLHFQIRKANQARNPLFFLP
ncbi:MAG: peptidoglycan DD-metalloendopeptidase family protein [Deltaproteobacteria bacterium]|nr:peptidoglycan DD-metalloendopeptidase family protein [Deltaproteobacteria bacterium]